MGGRCVGNIPPIEPINGRGWPGLCLEVRLAFHLNMPESQLIMLLVYTGLTSRRPFRRFRHRLPYRYQRSRYVRPMPSCLFNIYNEQSIYHPQVQSWSYPPPRPLHG